MFRIGSVSKVFVWVAVMQQVAAGGSTSHRHQHLSQGSADSGDLSGADHADAPHDAYRRIRGQADHRVFARGPQTVGDFHENLQSMMPRRMWMPGGTLRIRTTARRCGAPRRSGFGAKLGRLRRQPDTQAALMIDTTTRQPVPKVLEDHVSNGYWWEEGRYVKAPFEFVTIPPAGSVSSSGADMGRFMLELLAHGDTPTMAATTRASLFAPGYKHDSRLNQTRYGVYEQNSHGQTLMGHNGDTLAFHSMLLLCPDLNLGIFASYNNERGEKARDDWCRRSSIARSARRKYIRSPIRR